MANTYTTIQGDTWDIISLKVYGSELYTAELVAANFEQRKVLSFGAGTVLNVPDITAEEVENTNLPPWRRSQ